MCTPVHGLKSTSNQHTQNCQLNSNSTNYATHPPIYLLCEEHTTWIWIWMTKRPVSTSENGFIFKEIIKNQNVKKKKKSCGWHNTNLTQSIQWQNAHIFFFQSSWEVHWIVIFQMDVVCITPEKILRIKVQYKKRLENKFQQKFILTFFSLDIFS